MKCEIHHVEMVPEPRCPQCVTTGIEVNEPEPQPLNRPSWTHSRRLIAKMVHDIEGFRRAYPTYDWDTMLAVQLAPMAEIDIILERIGNNLEAAIEAAKREAEREAQS